MKIFNYYSNNVDKTWYHSSNIVYSECEDVENDFKRLKIVYSTGAQYLYEDVDVRDYVAFREAQSQGKAFNSWLKEKKPKYTKLENANLDAIEDEYLYRSGKGLFIQNEPYFEILDSRDNSLLKKDMSLDKNEFELVKEVLTSVGTIFKIKEN